MISCIATLCTRLNAHAALLFCSVLYTVYRCVNLYNNKPIPVIGYPQLLPFVKFSCVLRVIVSHVQFACQ